MLTYTDFQFSAYQAAIFFPGLRLSVSKLIRQLLQDLDQLLDGDPLTLPVPSEAPDEIPRLYLPNKNQSLRLDVSFSRADFRWQRTTEPQELALEQFLRDAQRAFLSFQKATRVLPGRLALVVHRFKPQENPGRILASHFCRPDLLSQTPKGPLNRPEAFELHAFKQFQLTKFSVNSWFRAKTGTTAIDGPRPIVFIEQDLNTPQEQLAETEFSDADVREYHEACRKELDVIMRLYFPGGKGKSG